MPYAYGRIPMDRDGDTAQSSLTEEMYNVHGHPPCECTILLAEHHNQVEFPTRWQLFIAYIQDMLKQPAKYDWWESGEITPKLMRLWGMR